jgi:hypothetical protein
MISWKELKGNRHGLIQIISNYLHGGTEENHEPPSLIRVAGVLAKIQTKNLMNMSLNHYHYTSLFGYRTKEIVYCCSNRVGYSVQQRSVHSEMVLRKQKFCVKNTDKILGVQFLLHDNKYNFLFCPVVWKNGSGS